jgi:putative N6-adenine-specific DNA methylase
MNQYFATVARGLEEIAAVEITNLGAKNVTTSFTGVSFEGDKELLYRVNLWSRIIFRVLVPITKIRSFNAEQLYRNVQEIDWAKYLNPKMTLAVNCTGKNQQLNHTHFTALQIKNAIVDWQQKHYGKRSDVDPNAPDLLVNAHIDNNYCVLSLDSSGSSLHRRGYRPAVGLAPLKESLAAALIALTEWDGENAFYDPLCGSGTLPIEATLKALNIAPGLFRNSFGFQHWLDYDETLWNRLVIAAKEQQKLDISCAILGSDRDQGILLQAQENAVNCQVTDYLQFFHQDLSQVTAPAETGIIICNPPYGERLGNVAELEELYKMLGDVFKQHFTGWTAYILTGNKHLSKKVGLRTAKRIPVYNGSLPCTLLKYELY